MGFPGNFRTIFLICFLKTKISVFEAEIEACPGGLAHTNPASTFYMDLLKGPSSLAHAPGMCLRSCYFSL